MRSALVLATLLWGWVTDRQDPIESEQFDDIEIAIPPLPNTLQVVNELEPVTVEITGPRSLLEDVQPRDVGASLDLGDIDQSGTYRVSVNAEVPDDVTQVAGGHPFPLVGVSRTVPLHYRLGRG